jgi:hypothetical protein
MATLRVLGLTFLPAGSATVQAYMPTAVLLYDVLPDQAADAGTTGRGSDTVAVGCWTPAPTALDGVHVASHDPGQRGTSRVAGLRR